MLRVVTLQAQNFTPEGTSSTVYEPVHALVVGPDTTAEQVNEYIRGHSGSVLTPEMVAALSDTNEALTRENGFLRGQLDSANVRVKYLEGRLDHVVDRAMDLVLKAGKPTE